jgi:hypothetical protein
MRAAEPASFDTVGETIRTNHYEGRELSEFSMVTLRRIIGIPPQSYSKTGTVQFRRPPPAEQ